jgi:hypothetical protein
MWEWLGEPLAMDFANTTHRRGAVDLEMLREPADLAEWVRAQGDESVPRVDEWAAAGVGTTLAEVRAFRDDVQRLLHAVADGRPHPADAVERINAAARAVPLVPQLRGGRAVLAAAAGAVGLAAGLLVVLRGRRWPGMGRRYERPDAVAARPAARPRTDEERAQAIRGVAGYTAVGLGRDKRMVENLRDRGVIRRAEDLGIDKRLATRDLLAARSVKDLVRASGGLYDPPKRFRNW